MAVADSIAGRGLDDQLAGLVSNGKTIKVLTVLTERPASPKEIGELLDLKIPVVSHHVRKLVDLGLVELVEERIVGSAIQHVYRAVVRPLIGNEEWEKLGLVERQSFSFWIVQLILMDAARSFATALFDAAATNHLSRTAMVLDREGFEEVSAIQDRALAEIFEAQARSSERMADSGETGVNVVTAMMSFQVPEGVKQIKIEEVASAVPLEQIRKSN